MNWLSLTNTTANFKKADKLSSTSQESRQYTSKQSRKIVRFEHVTGCTWNHKDLNKLCPKICDKNNTMCQGNLQENSTFIPLSLTFTLSKFKLESKRLVRELSDMGNFRVTNNQFTFQESGQTIEHFRRV